MTLPAYSGTSVPVERSHAEVRKLLQKVGARSFTFGEVVLNETTYVGVEFVVAHRRVRLRVPLKEPDPALVRSTASRARTKDRSDVRAELLEKEARRIWRVIAWNVKARLVGVQEGVETFDEAFLPHIVVPASGVTVYESLRQTGRVETRDMFALPPGDA